MKKRYKFFRCMILCGLIIIILVGCISPSSISSTPLEQVSTGIYPSPFETISLTPTSIDIATPTRGISIPTQETTQTIPIPTVFNPTMTVDQRRTNVLKLLETNNGCDLPCWWGIVPGQSSWSTVELFLQNFGVRIGSSTEENGQIYHGTGGFDFEEEQVRNNFGFTEIDTIVQSIHITSDGYSNPSFFQTMWRNYSPQRVLQKYSSPSRVFIRVDSNQWGNRNTQPYRLWMVYDPLGFIIQYNGFVQDGPIFHICPRFEKGQDIAYLRMFLQSPTSSVSLDPVNNFTQNDRGKIRSIEEASGLSPKEFYKLFVTNDKPHCIDTPADIW